MLNRTRCGSGQVYIYRYENSRAINDRISLVLLRTETSHNNARGTMTYSV